jgi:protein involved in polysaccharide export with SLBB domain
MKNHRFETATVVALLLGLGSAPAFAQDQRPVDVRKAQATRSELQAGLEELDKVVGSTGYSKSLRKAKEAEAVLVRQRLEEGDFQVGDQIDVSVVGETTLTGKFTVLPDRTLSFPQLPSVSLKGVLRSEVRDYLAAEIGKYVKNAQVTIQGSYIRVAFLGAVGKPGFYTITADRLLSDAIMDAGGPQGDIQMEKSVVKRGGKEVVPEGELQRAVQEGQSLDQLNLHGGDEIVLAAKGGGLVGGNGRNSGGSSLRNILLPAQILLSLTFVLSRVLKL